MLDVVLFDVDGTLVDTNPAIVEAFHETLLEISGIDESAEKLQTILGMAGLDTARRWATSEEQAEAMLVAWANRTGELSRTAGLFDGMADTLTALKARGLRLGIVTSREDWEMERDIDRLGLGAWFDVFITAADTERHKPDAQPVEEALRRLSTPGSAAVYVGDSVYDMGTAVNAGVEFALAKWGATRPEAITKADVVLQSPPNLLTYVDKRMAE